MIAACMCRKAGDARAVLVSEFYQEILKAAVLDGRLDAAESPAAVLNELISQVGMPGEQVLTHLRYVIWLHHPALHLRKKAFAWICRA